MKLKLLLIALLFSTTHGFAQDALKVFDEVKNVTIRNSGVIKKNNTVKGYYNFYEFDKVDRKTRIYKLNIIDENLNDLGTKEITGPKEWELISGGFDGTNFCFKFWDEKTKSFELKVYDQKADEVNSLTSKINYSLNGMKYHSFSQMTSNQLNIDENNGFIDYMFNDTNDAFLINYLDGATKKSWSEAYTPEGKSKIMVPNFLGGNDKMILTAVTRVDKGMYNMNTEHSILASSTKDGSKLFELSTEFDDNHVVPVNVIFQDGKIVIVGLNYKSGKTFSTSPDGFAFLEVDNQGKLLKRNFKTLEESLGKYLPMENHKLAGNYNLFIHDIVHTKNNSNLIIAEKFKKAADAGGIALSVFSGGSAGVIKLQLENMVVMEYDQDGNLLQAKEIPKAKGTTATFPSYIGLLSSYFLANYASSVGEMDYEYTQKNEDNNEITFSFVDYDRLDDGAGKTKNFGQIRYKGGSLTVDKIAIKKDKADFTQLLPAKTNHVLQISYYKKQKKLSMELIKLNN